MPDPHSLDPVAHADMLVGCVIRHALDDLAKTHPAEGKWLMGLLRDSLSSPEFRLIRQRWELPDRWPAVPRDPDAAFRVNVGPLPLA